MSGPCSQSQREEGDYRGEKSGNIARGKSVDNFGEPPKREKTASVRVSRH